MKMLKRLVAGIAFTAVIALTLVASGADAYAKTKPAANANITSGTTLTRPAAAPGSGSFQALGVTWE